MAGRQRTFELIPTSLARSNGPLPPMTSKAAKKAYQKASRGPRMTRKERRDADAAELEAQKKEYEKEKNAARAKAAREKKAEKAAKERETRRKMGLPEPSKYVRASQPTISRFVRSGSKRTWDELDDITEDSDGTLDGLRGGMDQPPANHAPDSDVDDEFGYFPPLFEPDILERLDSPSVSIKEENAITRPPKKYKTSALKPRKPSSLKSVQSGKSRTVMSSSKQCAIPPPLKKEISDTGFGEFPSLSQCDILERLASSATPPIPGNAAATRIGAPRTGFPPKLRAGNELKAMPVVPSGDKFAADNPQELVDMAATQLLSEAADADSRSARTDTAPIPQPSKLSPRQSAGSPIRQIGLKNVIKFQEKQMPTKAAFSDRLALTKRPLNMPPPPKPPKSNMSISFANSPDKSRPVFQKRANTFPKTPLGIPPSATQVFLEEHIDVFFPSPSQQIKELLKDVVDMPSNTQVAREISPSKPAHDDALTDLFSTQDVSLSTEDMVEITTPCRATEYHAEAALAPALTLEDHTKRVSITNATREKRRFFEEKEDDLLHAAIHESKVLAAAKKAEKAPHTNESLAKTRGALKRALSEASDYGFDDDFSGCSQELLALP